MIWQGLKVCMTTLALGLASHAQAKDDVKYKNLYPGFMTELQNAKWNWSTAMDLMRTDIKQKNKIFLLTFFCFRIFQQYKMETRSKTNVFERYNLQRNPPGKKSQRTAIFMDQFLSY